MLTKKLKFDDEVLAVLRSMKWSDDGLSAQIDGQLDRALYVKVNKALEAMKGKWNRSAKAHIFATDPRPLVEGLIENGVLEVPRDGFFETPPAVIDRMFSILPPATTQGAYLEPSAGLGAIAERISGSTLYLVEQNAERCAVLREKFPEAIVLNQDFLTIPRHLRFIRAYMNPPFEQGQDIDHVNFAYRLLLPGGAVISVMSSGAISRSDTKSANFRNWLEDKVSKFEAEVEDLPAGSFKSSGTNVNTILVAILKGAHEYV
jgi:hypothetical protein